MEVKIYENNGIKVGELQTPTFGKLKKLNELGCKTDDLESINKFWLSCLTNFEQAKKLAVIVMGSEIDEDMNPAILKEAFLDFLGECGLLIT